MNICIYNYKIANTLLKHGYTMISMRPNKKEIGLLVFYFKREDGIEALIQQHTKSTNMTKGEVYGEFCASTERLVSRERWR